jgi:hypothetical protein
MGLPDLRNSVLSIIQMTYGFGNRIGFSQDFNNVLASDDSGDADDATASG